MQTTAITASGQTRSTENQTAPQRLDWFLILLMAGAALAIRLYLYPFYDVISVDGTGYVGAARKLLNGDLSGLSFYGFYPLLISLASITARELETAAQLVSAVAGGLLVVPLYLLGLSLFSRPTAIAACLVTMVWRSHLQVSTIVANQAAYTTLALTAVLLVWLMLERRSAVLGCWSGLAMGLAFLTRPEAFLLFFVMPLVPLIDGRRDLQRMWRPLTAYGVVFVIILGLNTLLVYRYTGTWQLAAKTSSALIDTLSYHLDISDLNKRPGIEQVGYLDFIIRWPDLLLNNITKNLTDLVRTIVPLPLWLLALAGFLSGGAGRARMTGRLFLLCSFAPLGVIVIFYYIGEGYVEPFLPVLFLWAAEGARGTERFVTGLAPVRQRAGAARITAWSPAVLAASLIYAAMVLVPQIPGKRDLSKYTWQDDDSRRDQKNIGLMLKQYLPPGKIMTQSARIAFYSGHEMVGIPNTDLPGIAQAAAEGKARFLVLHGRMNGSRPALNELYQPLMSAPAQFFSIAPPQDRRRPGLHLLLTYSNPTSLGVVVYEIVD